MNAQRTFRYLRLRGWRVVPHSSGVTFWRDPLNLRAFILDTETAERAQRARDRRARATVIHER